ncbi:sensor histidine kinase [Amycolatopsis nigrescens]|uniref:sensor histidine kinase n=1 Tax=Amycolatopsis nigrescens TaxID=381445 RepID=UPI00035E35B9|nr:ATP-binding protein [Amycolatopsis nigrescens]
MTRVRLSVRSRLTALYGGFFLLAGVILLIINYLLVSGSLPDTTAYAVTAARRLGAVEQGPVEVPPGVVPGQAVPMPTSPADSATVRLLSTSIDDYRASTLSTLLVQSGVALVVLAGLAVLIGWAMASRALRPLHAITSTARRLGAESLDRRINLNGPSDELKELADTFDGMLDRLAGSFDSQRRFVANASHELRTPLAVQRTLIEVAMADPEVTPEVRRLGGQLLYTNERSERMIEGLLTLARSDRGLVSRTPVRLDDVAASVLRAMSGKAAEAGVALEPVLRPRVVPGDPVLLERLITNLVQNAIAYNVRDGTVRVHVGPDPALVVANSGPAVPAELVPGLFEPFRRLTPERTGDSRHAGLGLSIVRSVAGAHGGTVHAEPGAGGGLVVTVRLPGTN